jgi:hypothetical protein
VLKANSVRCQFQPLTDLLSHARVQFIPTHVNEPRPSFVQCQSHDSVCL